MRKKRVVARRSAERQTMECRSGDGEIVEGDAEAVLSVWAVCRGC